MQRFCTLTSFFLILVLLGSRAVGDTQVGRQVLPGYGLRVFLGYVYDFTPNSTQSDFVEKKLASFGIQSKDYGKVIKYLRSLNGEIEEKTAKGAVRLLCSDSVATLHGAELQAVFNAVLDYDDATYAAYSAIVAADFAGFGYPDFVRRLTADVKSAELVKPRFPVSSNNGSEYFENQRAAICGQATNTNGTTN